MNNPTITYRHVNSIYVRQDVADNGYEVGWRWPAGENPQFFVVKLINGNYTQNIVQYNVPKGTNHFYSINIESNLPGTPVNFLIDGQLKKSWTAVFPEGYVAWGSERQNTNESNYAHFWTLTRRQHDFVWKNWSNMAQKWDKDTGYHYYEASNTEGYSVAD